MCTGRNKNRMVGKGSFEEGGPGNREPEGIYGHGEPVFLPAQVTFFPPSPDRERIDIDVDGDDRRVGKEPTGLPGRQDGEDSPVEIIDSGDRDRGEKRRKSRTCGDGRRDLSFSKNLERPFCPVCRHGIKGNGKLLEELDGKSLLEKFPDPPARKNPPPRKGKAEDRPRSEIPYKGKRPSCGTIPGGIECACKGSRACSDDRAGPYPGLFHGGKNSKMGDPPGRSAGEDQDGACFDCQLSPLSERSGEIPFRSLRFSERKDPDAPCRARKTGPPCSI